MKPQFRIVRGTPAGTVVVYSHHNITIGRHPDSDIAFDAHKDLQVSVRHAAIFKRADRWYLRDMGSRNGTLVNGHKITADTALNDTDQIQLAAGGPAIECRFVGDDVPNTERSPAATSGKIRATPLATPSPRSVDGSQQLRDHCGGNSVDDPSPRPHFAGIEDSDNLTVGVEDWAAAGPVGAVSVDLQKLR